MKVIFEELILQKQTQPLLGMITSAEDVFNVTNKLIREGAEAIIIPHDRNATTKAATIARLCSDKDVITCCLDDGIVGDGIMFAVSVPYKEVGKLIGEMICNANENYQDLKQMPFIEVKDEAVSLFINTNLFGRKELKFSQSFIKGIPVTLVNRRWKHDTNWSEKHLSDFVDATNYDSEKYSLSYLVFGFEIEPVILRLREEGLNSDQIINSLKSMRRKSNDKLVLTEGGEEFIQSLIDSGLNSDEILDVLMNAESTSNDTLTGMEALSPILSTHLLTEGNLNGITKEELRLLRNEIYARHGYIFNTRDLHEYFSAKDWYKPQFNDVSHLLNTIEQKNVEFIQKHE